MSTIRMYWQILAIDDLILTDPLGYLDFLRLMSGAELILSDSGGIQEESCILGVPCVTLRENTERPETVTVGANVVAGTDPDEVLSHAVEMRQGPHEWENPFGDGTAAIQIVDTILGKSR